MSTLTTLTDSGVLSSRPIIIYGVNLLNDGIANSNLNLRDGTTVSASLVIQVLGSQAQGISYDFGKKGLTFRNGCYVEFPAHTSGATIWWSLL